MEIIVFALSGLTLILILTALAVPLAKYIRLPLPVVIAAAGLVAGTAAEALGLRFSEAVLDAYDIWFVQQLTHDTGVLLFIFLPPLLFEMALAVNVRRLLDDLSTVLVMAVLAVAVATAAIGFAVWSASAIGLVACLLLGAAVATTDPAAVVTTFREIGAPKRLQVVLEGESLLNDAAAIAIFTILLAAISTGADITPTDFAVQFVVSFAGGALTGLVLSLAAAGLYPLLGQSSVAETSLTLALAYASYLVSEQLFGVSGVVAVVIAGLTTGSWGFVRMGPRNWATVSAVWNQIGFWANALILLLVSLLTPGVLLGLSWEQALLAPLVYVCAFAARAVILYGLLPLLNWVGLATSINQPQKALILWGGVRGSVTLVLALSLTQITGLDEDAAVIGALAAAFTLMTLVFNASTLAFVTRWLKLDQLSKSDIALRDRIVAGAIERVRNVVIDLAGQRKLEPEALASVEKALGQHQREVEAQSQGEHIAFEDQLRLGLTILGGQEARLVRRAFEDGAIGPRTTNRLRLAADRIADSARAEGRAGYQKAAEKTLRNTRAWWFCITIYRFLKWDQPLRKLIEFALADLLETERTLRELDRFAENTLAAMIGLDATRSARGLLLWRLDLIRRELEALGKQYPLYFANLEQVLITRAALRRERHQYERLFADGIIESELRDDLIGKIAKREYDAAQPPVLDLELSAQAVLERSSLFSGLTPKQMSLISKKFKNRFVSPGEEIIAKGDRFKGLIFVASGVLAMQQPDDIRHFTAGDFFGELAPDDPTASARNQVTSVGYSRLLTLSLRDFNRIRQKDPTIGPPRHVIVEAVQEETA